MTSIQLESQEIQSRITLVSIEGRIIISRKYEWWGEKFSSLHKAPLRNLRKRCEIDTEKITPACNTKVRKKSVNYVQFHKDEILFLVEAVPH